MVRAVKEEAAAINNEGVRLLKVRKVDESTKFFADALRGCRRIQCLTSMLRTR
jgi:hypothetical protein